MSRNEKRIRAALAVIGCDPLTVEWESVGQMIEMCGRLGGWMIDGEPFGYSVDEVLDYIRDYPTTIRKRLRAKAG